MVACTYSPEALAAASTARKINLERILNINVCSSVKRKNIVQSLEVNYQ